VNFIHATNRPTSFKKPDAEFQPGAGGSVSLSVIQPVSVCRRDIGLEKGETLITGVKHVDGGKWALLDENGKEVGYFNQAKSFPPKLEG